MFHPRIRITMGIALLLILTCLQIYSPVAAQTNSIDDVVVSVPVCDGFDGRLRITFTIDGQPNRYLENSLGIGSLHVAPPFFNAGTNVVEIQYVPPAGTGPGTILTVTVKLGTVSFLSDLDSETFSFNCSTGEKVAGPVAPFAAFDSAYMRQGSSVTINVAANDIDANGDLNPASVTAATNPPNGTLVNNGDGSFTYTPNAGFIGLDEFTYQICDFTNLCSIGSVRVEVAPANQPPVANDDFASTTEGVALSIGVVDNDINPESSPFDPFQPSSLILVSGPSNGTAISDNFRHFTYTPNGGFTGTDSFTYQVCDDGNLCDTAVVTVTVNPRPPDNRPPVAVDDFISTPENQAVGIAVTENDTDPDGNLDSATTTIVSNPSNGTLFNYGNGAILYTPNTYFNGTDQYEYQVCDTDNLCDTATVVIEVVAQDSPPVANTDTVTTPENTPVTIDVAANDFDGDGNLDVLSATSLAGPFWGTLNKNADGTFTYTPALDYKGRDSFSYQICDLTNLCATTGSVEIILTLINDPPTAYDDHVSTPGDTRLTIFVGANDIDPDDNLDPTTARALSEPTHGTLLNIGGGRFWYTPDGSYIGMDSFTYEICDAYALCASATVFIDVLPYNHPPVANDDQASTTAGTAVVINVIANDADPDNNIDPVWTNATFTPANGALTNNGDGTFTYTPNVGFAGLDGFVYQICDAGLLCATARVFVEVRPSNNPPDCSAARPTLRTLWPPTHWLIPVQIRGVTDADGDRVRITITSITQDEPDRGLGRGDRYPDSFGVGSRTAWLRAERDPNGDGRVYTIAFTADDGKGGVCSGSVTVTVPHRQGGRRD